EVDLGSADRSRVERRLFFDFAQVVGPLCLYLFPVSDSERESGQGVRESFGRYQFALFYAIGHLELSARPSSCAGGFCSDSDPDDGDLTAPKPMLSSHFLG
ncbi:unnamed protein product, partial [Amoebophrya sp. A25]